MANEPMDTNEEQAGRVEARNEAAGQGLAGGDGAEGLAVTAAEGAAVEPVALHIGIDVGSTTVKLAILDETDSGLDVDALGVVSRGIDAYRSSTDGALVVITHNTRILEHLDVDRVHVMVRGRMVAEGDASLIDAIDEQGFEQFEQIER